VSTTTYFNRTNAGVGLVLNWSFFDLSRGPSINAASEALAQQRFLFDVTARNLVLETQLAYFSLQEQRQLIRAYEEILAATDRQVALTEAQFNDGMVSIADVEQIRTQQYGTLSILIGVYRQLFDSAALVAQLMALPPGTLVLSADDLSVLGAWGQPLPSTISQALKLREEIKASLAASASASWTATSLFNQYWPQFSLGANGNYFGDSVASGAPGASLAAIDRSSQLNWSGGVGIGFNWQLFDGGINAAQAESSKALARQFLNRAAVERLNVTREVEQAYTSYVTSQLVTQSASEQVASARKAVVAVEERFRVGVTDMATVVQTLTQAILAANAYATAVRTYNVSVANLYRSSARWPDGVQPLLERRVGALQRQ
jgi:outer membrane protein TolC